MTIPRGAVTTAVVLTYQCADQHLAAEMHEGSVARRQTTAESSQLCLLPGFHDHCLRLRKGGGVDELHTGSQESPRSLRKVLECQCFSLGCSLCCPEISILHPRPEKNQKNSFSFGSLHAATSQSFCIPSSPQIGPQLTIREISLTN